MHQKLLVLTAMPEERLAIEAELLRSQGSNSKVDILECGVGSISAAIRLTRYLEKQRPDAVLLMGVAGALTTDLEIGDFVVATRVYQHDSVSTFPLGTFWMNPGRFIIDPIMAEANENAGWSCDAAFLDYFRSKLSDEPVRYGVLASGAEFVASYERKQAIADHPPRPIFVEMEGAGVAAVCAEYGVPFLIAKTIADRLNPDHSIATDFSKCLEQAAAHAALMVSRVLASERG